MKVLLNDLEKSGNSDILEAGILKVEELAMEDKTEPPSRNINGSITFESNNDHKRSNILTESKGTNL